MTLRPTVGRAKPVPIHLVGFPMFTAPYDIVVIPKPNKPVKFIMKYRDRDSKWRIAPT